MDDRAYQLFITRQNYSKKKRTEKKEEFDNELAKRKSNIVFCVDCQAARTYPLLKNVLPVSLVLPTNHFGCCKGSLSFWPILVPNCFVYNMDWHRQTGFPMTVSSLANCDFDLVLLWYHSLWRAPIPGQFLAHECLVGVCVLVAAAIQSQYNWMLEKSSWWSLLMQLALLVVHAVTESNRRWRAAELPRHIAADKVLHPTALALHFVVFFVSSHESCSGAV